MKNTRRPLTDQEINEAEKLKSIWLRYKANNPGATQEWLGRETKIGSQGAVGQYLLGKIPLNINAAIAFSEVLKFDLGEISPRWGRLDRISPWGEEYEGHKKRIEFMVDNWDSDESLFGKKSAGKSDTVDLAGYHRAEHAKIFVPLIDWIQAGNWDSLSRNFKYEDAQEWIPCPFVHGDKAFVLRVSGESMFNPTGNRSYAPGDYIVVEPTPEPENSRAVLVKRQKDRYAVLKQLIIESDGTKILQSTNPSWPNRVITMTDDMKFIGMVTGKWQMEWT